MVNGSLWPAASFSKHKTMAALKFRTFPTLWLMAMRVPASDEWYLCCWLVHCLPASIEQQRSNMIPSISILQVNNGGNRSKANQGNQINWAVIVNQRASWRWPNDSPRGRQNSGKRYDPHLASELDLHTADRLNTTCHSNQTLNVHQYF